MFATDPLLEAMLHTLLRTHRDMPLEDAARAVTTPPAVELERWMKL